MQDMDIKLIAKQLVSLSVQQVNELAKVLKEDYNIEPAAATAVAVAAPAAAEVVEEKTNFDVVLKDVGNTKLVVIKMVKTILGLGLKESKELVDQGAGAIIKSNVLKEEAESLKKQLEEAGATIELK